MLSLPCSPSEGDPGHAVSSLFSLRFLPASFPTPLASSPTALWGRGGGLQAQGAGLTLNLCPLSKEGTEEGPSISPHCVWAGLAAGAWPWFTHLW